MDGASIPVRYRNVAVSVPALSEKDEEDLRWALDTKVDMIALSFVRSAADIEPVHRIMDEKGVRPVIDRVYEFEQANEALEYFSNTGKIGKVVIRV